MILYTGKLIKMWLKDKHEWNMRINVFWEVTLSSLGKTHTHILTSRNLLLPFLSWKMVEGS
jgi:hypothetical protein